MTTFSKIEIERLASLSALHFTEEEKEEFAKEFASITNFVQTIVDAKIEKTNLEERTLNLEQLRDDEPIESLPQDKVLLNSPKTKSGQFCVPKMLE